MEIILNFINYLQSLTKKQVQQYFLVFLLGMGGAVSGLIYFVHSKSVELLFEIKRLESLANKATSILEENQKMEIEEQRIQAMLDADRNFNIKSYFEGFCQTQGLPSQGWGDARTEELNDKFDEVSLTASFKGQTTEKLVRILEDFYKKEIIYIKSLNVKQEPDKKISFNITIATKSLKSGFDVKGL
ncbi:MAG: hypothetical protein WCS92_01140 [Candidatus Babeliales bacterium]|jgi:hypothetical protein|nr:MAG: hypothetical protein US22_C0009G0002 [candidate division TM6 bacterium GW2011_GWF2_36_6]